MYPSEEELESVRLEGVVEPAKLPVGTTIFVETTKHVFEFVFKKRTLYVSSSNTEAISGQYKCQIAGSIDENGTLFAGLIVRNRHLIIDLHRHGRYVTGLVKSVSLRGPCWSYEMWPHTEAKLIGE
jgi:hypothetical protein